MVSLLGQTPGGPTRGHFFSLLCACLNGIPSTSPIQMHCNAKISLKSQPLHVTVCSLHPDTASNVLVTLTGPHRCPLGMNNWINTLIETK